jgi:nucleotide-binding universal stress UspA family protein
MLTEHQIDPHSSIQRRHIERILCPTDMSPDSDHALQYAITLARTYGAKLFLCHCVEEPSPNTYRHIRELSQVKRIFEESIGPRIDITELSSLDWEGVIVAGKAAETIALEAAERHVDLIVMRSRRSPLAAALLGSTAESICRTAPCPVLVTHSPEREWVNDLNGKIELKRVLVAHDFSYYSELALSFGFSLAKEYQSELHLLHVLPRRLKSTMFPAEESDFHRAIRNLHNSIPEGAQLWCNIKEEVREGQPYYEILTYAEENDIDLICIGAHGLGIGKWALFGSNTDRVLRQALCPILIARPLKPVG